LASIDFLKNDIQIGEEDIQNLLVNMVLEDNFFFKKHKSNKTPFHAFHFKMG
jgi:hypothetical protein